jgi:hypothetical protein
VEALLEVLQEISNKLSDISSQLNSICGVNNIDDLVFKIEDAVDSIIGETRYNLTDIFKELSDINSNISSLG